MMRNHKNRSLKWILMVPVCVVVILAVGLGLYVMEYYHADANALAALESDEAVAVTQTEYGWYFDGPAQKDALIFYPGAIRAAPPRKKDGSSWRPVRGSLSRRFSRSATGNNLLPQIYICI